MHRVNGVLLNGRNLRLAAWLVSGRVEDLMRRDATLPAGTRELRDFLATEAGREIVAVVVDRGSAPAQVSGKRGNAEAAAAVILECSRPEMTTAQVAAWLGITARSVRNLCHSGDLLARRDCAGRWAIDAGSAAALAARRKES